MTVIARSGRFFPLFCFLIAASFQRLTVARKMPASVFASSRRWFAGDPLRHERRDEGAAGAGQ
jgi:hypothetical protein